MPIIKRNPDIIKLPAAELYKYYEVISDGIFFRPGNIISRQINTQIAIIRDCGLEFIPYYPGIERVEIRELRPGDVITIKIENQA